MASARFAWGIDVGNRALKAVKLVPDGAGYRIDDFEVIEHETVLSNAGDNRESLIQTALATFVERHPQRGGIAAIGVSGQQSFARFIKLPPVEEKKIPEIVRFEAIQQIPFPLDDVEWAYQLFRDPESPDVEVGIFAIRKDLIARHIGYFTDVDLNVQVVQMNPLAVYNAMYHDGQIEGTTMIIDLGAENADLIIAEGETIWLRSIPIGGNNFTEALVKAFKLNFAKAEELKRNAATSKYARQIMQAMKPVFADLVGEVQRSIGFYASVHRDSRITKVLALGGTFRLPSLQKYLSQNLQLEVHKVERLQAGQPDDAKVATSYSENLLSSVGAYGLALQALGEGKINSSLLPATIKREKMWRDKTRWFAAAAALFVLGTGIKMGATKLDQLKLDNASELQRHNDDILARAKSQSNQWSVIEQEGGPDRQLILNVKSLEKYRHLWTRVLADVHTAIMSAAPQPELLSGDVKKIKSIDRKDRRQIFLEHFNSVYISDLSNLIDASPTDFASLAASSGGAAGTSRTPSPTAPVRGAPFSPMYPPGARGPMMPGGYPPPTATDTEDAAASTKPRGYLITLNLRTPNSGGFTFVSNTLVKSLQSINIKEAFPDRHYYVGRVAIISTMPVSNRPDAGNNTRTPTGGGGFRPPAPRNFGPGATPRRAFTPGGMPPMTGATGAGNEGTIQRPTLPSATESRVEIDPFVDPATGEDIRKGDTDVTVAFVIVLDPPAPEAVDGAVAVK